MIINFNFNVSKVEFIWQQNKNQYFAVNFLMDSASKRDFKAIIEEVLSSNEEIIRILQKEKNYVVLPDDIAGYGNLDVPYSFWNSKNYFQTSFDTLYNKNNNLVYSNKLFNSNKNVSTYLFVSIRKQIIDDILNTFGKYSIRIMGMSTYSNVLYDYVIKNHGELSKHNILIFEKENNFNIYAVSHNFILGYKNVKLDANDQIFAKKYVKFAKNNLKQSGFYKNDMDDLIEKSKIEQEYPIDAMQKIRFTIDDFKNHFKTSKLNIIFDRTVLLNSKTDFESDNQIISLVFDKTKILASYKTSNIYLSRKRGLLWKRKFKEKA